VQKKQRGTGYGNERSDRRPRADTLLLDQHGQKKDEDRRKRAQRLGDVQGQTAGGCGRFVLSMSLCAAFVP
jgi:hypothetical protein